MRNRSQAPMPSGFRRISRRRVARFTFIRYVAQGRHRPTVDQLRNARLDETRAAILIERPR